MLLYNVLLIKICVFIDLIESPREQIGHEMTLAKF